MTCPNIDPTRYRISKYCTSIDKYCTYTILTKTYRRTQLPQNIILVKFSCKNWGVALLFGRTNPTYSSKILYKTCLHAQHPHINVSRKIHYIWSINRRNYLFIFQIISDKKKTEKKILYHISTSLSPTIIYFPLPRIKKYNLKIENGPTKDTHANHKLTCYGIHTNLACNRLFLVGQNHVHDCDVGLCHSISVSTGQ